MVIAAATKNNNKIREIAAITGAFGIDIISRAEAGVPDDVEIEEDGETFEEIGRASVGKECSSRWSPYH